MTAIRNGKNDIRAGRPFPDPEQLNNAGVDGGKHVLDTIPAIDATPAPNGSNINHANAEGNNESAQSSTKMNTDSPKLPGLILSYASDDITKKQGIFLYIQNIICLI